MTFGLNFRQCSSPFLDDGRVQRLPILTHAAGEDEHLFTEPPTDQKPEQQGARPVGRSAQSPGCEMPALHWLPCIEPEPGPLRGRLPRE